MKQSRTNEDQIMNYLHCLRKEPGKGTGSDSFMFLHSGADSRYNDENCGDKPNRSVVDNILSYARALDTLKTKSGDVYFLLSN